MENPCDANFRQRKTPSRNPCITQSKQYAKRQFRVMSDFGTENYGEKEWCTCQESNLKPSDP